MTAVTPKAANHNELGPLDSRYVDVEAMEWEPTPYPGVEWKILLKDEASGLLTALFKWAPGSELPLHEHTRIEQTFVLEGSIEDEEGEVTAGNFVWRPAGSRHVAKSRNGALLLGTFLQPNKFF
ncbi:MAG: cupin domain-containing protein [Thalassobaculaceae bacterium]|nr:cupin domain-containing protein [Thalassobaculaceae bacterium]